MAALLSARHQPDSVSREKAPMAKRIVITEDIVKRAESAPLDLRSCQVCGDDIVVHEWIDIDANGNIVACERS